MAMRPVVQTEILRILATVREFMFPESHAHSFAPTAYSSAYTKSHSLRPVRMDGGNLCQAIRQHRRLFDCRQYHLLSSA
jgi:hypothetical protein